MPLNVAFYSDALTSGRYGLGRHAWELFRELHKRPHELNLRPVSAHVALSDEEVQSLIADANYVRLPWRRHIAGLWSALEWPRLEHWTPWADLVHCVELDYCVPTRRPLVVTVHDLGPLTHPEFFRNSHPWLLKRALKYAVRSAASILCVSQATAEAVEHYAKESLGQRLVIIPEGVSAEFFEPVGDECFATMSALRDFVQSGTPYFLWAGSLNPRKNLPRVIKAFESVAGNVPHHLLLTGGLGWDSDETLQRAHDSSAAGRIHLPGRVSDEQLRGLYQRASGFVFVSLMEGFGLPILEAMASGCPVVTSALASMPEVAGDAALLVDPYDVSAIAGAMKRLAAEPALVELLVQRGRHRASAFGWERCAESVAKIYQRVARTGRKWNRASTRSPLVQNIERAAVKIDQPPAISQ